MSDSVSLLYVTTKNRAEARSLSQILLQEKLIACANILPASESMYRWQNKLTRAKETILLLKTTRRNAAKVTKRILALHSYSCPCVVELDVRSASSAFAAWIQKSIS